MKNKCNNKDHIKIKGYILKEFFVTKDKRGRVSASRQSKVSTTLEKDDGKNTQLLYCFNVLILLKYFVLFTHLKKSVLRYTLYANQKMCIPYNQ